MENNEVKKYSIASIVGYRDYYDDKSPLLYTFLIDRVGSSFVANELLMQIFYKLFSARKGIPETMPLDSFLMLITKKIIIDYFHWRTTEEGKNAIDQSISTAKCAELAEMHKIQLVEWVAELSEDENKAYEKYVLEKKEKSLLEQAAEIKKIEGTAGVMNRVKEWADKHGKMDNKKDNNGKPK